MNNPLPRWWMWLFIITVVFSAVYLAFYPGLGSFAGTSSGRATASTEAEQERARAAMAPLYAKYTTIPPAEAWPRTQAMGIGERLFLNNCAQCHGSDARGSKGFPNLADGDWLWGGAATTRSRETIARAAGA
jgi:cytochrome c oxidase cbb3-type subunit 3